MTSFFKYLDQLEPESASCAVCGRNRYFCSCDDTPQIDAPVMVVMFHTWSKKKMTVERYSDKYFVMRSQNWVELQ